MGGSKKSGRAGFHQLDLFLGQSVQLVNQLIDLVIRSLDPAGEQILPVSLSSVILRKYFLGFGYHSFCLLAVLV